MEKTITFNREDGPVTYLRYAARLPEFLAQFPPSQYSVEVVTTDLLSLQKGRLSLLKEAIAAGKKPVDVGLPGIEADSATLICTAILYDSQHRVVRTASASMSVQEHKDYETLETAANQRLLASLGFGGEIFDDDENRDVARIRGGAAVRPTPEPQTRLREPPVSVPAVAASTTASTEPPLRASGVTQALRRQVENLARRLNQAVPEMENDEDARRELDRLGALVPRRSAQA